MSARARAVSITALVAAVAAGLVVAFAARSGGEPAPQAAAKPRPGAPPLALDLGVRDDLEAKELRQALVLYDGGKRARARTLFARHRSLEAQVGADVAAWPHGTVTNLARLLALYPKSSLVQLELGLALFWSGRPGAEDAWRQAAVLQPDTAYAVTAENLLYPQYAKNLPVFVPARLDLFDRLGQAQPAAQLRTLRRWAENGLDGDRTIGHILYGVALQRLSRPLSARRQFDLAAELSPDNPEALTAAAVGHFEKANPSAAFSRLGPLARRFPRSGTVRFHLGVLLLWIGQVDQAKKELRLATTADPGSPAAREARQYLRTLANVGR